MKLGLALAGVLLAMPGLVSCGGDDDSSGGAGEAKEPKESSSVSVEDFCAAAEKFENTFTETDTSKLPQGVEAIKDAARELKDVGTPDDIPDDAREGLGLTLDKLISLPDDVTESGLLEAMDFSKDETAKSMAFESYLDATCDYRAADAG
jgi:hypothetical protein